MSNSYLTTEASEFTLPYGRHAGKLLREVPRPYLRWTYDQCDFKYFPEYQRAIEEHLGLTPDPNIRVGNRNKVSNQHGMAGGARVVGSSTHTPVRHVPDFVRTSPGTPCDNGLETGVDGFRRAFERSRQAALAEFADEPEIQGLLADVLGRVQQALGI